MEEDNFKLPQLPLEVIISEPSPTAILLPSVYQTPLGRGFFDDYTDEAHL